MNDERLIELVRKYSVLYDLSQPKYVDSSFKFDIWITIGKEMKADCKMFAKVLWILVCLLVSVEFSLSSVDGAHFTIERTRKRCTRNRLYGKVTSDCLGLQLDSVPPNLSTDIQVLDLSFNRIRELTRDSFSRYTSLQILYLDDNMINYVENDAFLPLQSLEVLVLSLSGINKVPTSIATLPALWKLDLSNNRFSPGGLDVLGQFPLDNNIKVLSLASSHLKQLPPLDKLLRMHELNISGNSLERLSITELAGMCVLNKLDLGESYSLLPQCDCLLLNQWVKNEGLEVFSSSNDSPTCGNFKDGDEEECQNSNTTLQALQLRNNCRKMLESQEHAAYVSKIWIYLGIALMGAAVAALMLVCMFRRRRAHSQKPNNNTGEKNAVDSLLDSREGIDKSMDVADITQDYKD